MSRAGRWARRLVVVAAVASLALGVRELMFRRHAAEAPPPPEVDLR
jgi:hypothetical protein